MSCQLSINLKLQFSPVFLRCFSRCPRHFILDISSFTQFPRSNTWAHTETQIEHHFNLALRSLEVTQRQVEDQSQEIERLTAHLNLALRSLEVTQRQVEDQSQKIERLTVHLNLALRSLEVTQRQVEDQSQEIERLTARVKVQDQHLKSLSSPPFVWKISDFYDSCLRAARGDSELSTSTFYLSPNGYKLKIKVVFNIHATCKGFHESLCLNVCVVPGEFDLLLSWPFKEKVKVTLLSQNPSRDAKEDISNVTDFGTLVKPVFRPLAEDKLTWHAVLGPIPQRKLSSASITLNNVIFIMVNKE